MLSETAKSVYRVLHGTETYTAEKLTATFSDRTKYGVHYRTLQTYVRLGLKITKVHRILAFQQSAFLEPYIRKCGELRRNARSNFESRLWKLFSNATYGKHIENVRKRINCTFCAEKNLTRYISSPLFSSFKIISENLVAVFSKQRVVKLNKAIAVGFTVLDLSKEFMYNEFYFKIRPLLQNCTVTVVLSDTDSFFLKTQTSESNPDHYKTLAPLMDFSNYDPAHKKFNAKFDSQVGYWKDELRGKKMVDLIALRSKTYLYRTEEEKVNSKIKGVTKGYKKTLTFEKFKKCLTQINSESVKQFHIRSKTHKVTTQEVNRVAITSFDDKRQVLFFIVI